MKWVSFSSENEDKLFSLGFLCLLWNGLNLFLLVVDKSFNHFLDRLFEITVLSLYSPSVFLLRFFNENLDAEWEFVATCSVIFVKFWLAITFFVINLQAMETYPTCLRQTGLSIGIICSNIIGIFGPYIVYLVSKFPFLFLNSSLCLALHRNLWTLVGLQLKVSEQEMIMSWTIF